MPLKLEWCEMICLKRCIKKKEKKEFLEKCKEVIKSKLSIEFIIEKFCELDKLKRTLLSEDQLDIFKKMPKLSLEEHIESIEQANNWKIHSLLSPRKTLKKPIENNIMNENASKDDSSVSIAEDKSQAIKLYQNE